MIKELFTTDIYVKIRRDSFEAKNLSTGDGWKSARSVDPFSTQRLLVGKFTAAQPALTKLLNDIQPKAFIKKSPQMVIHPMELIEGGISEVEERIFKELALGSGAFKVILHTGKELSDSEVQHLLKSA